MRVSIRLDGPLGARFAGVFEDLTVRTETVITGDVADDAALHGILARVRDLGVSMLDVRVEGRHDRRPVPTE